MIEILYVLGGAALALVLGLLFLRMYVSKRKVQEPDFLTSGKFGQPYQAVGTFAEPVKRKITTDDLAVETVDFDKFLGPKKRIVHVKHVFEMCAEGKNLVQIQQELNLPADMIDYLVDRIPDYIRSKG